MKKMILAVTLLALAGSQVQTVRAGDRGFAVAAGVLGGIAVGTAIADTIAHPPVYYAPAPAPVYYTAPPANYCPSPAVVYQPAPVVVYSQPVYALPAPVVTFGYGGYYRHEHRHFGGRW